MGEEDRGFKELFEAFLGDLLSLMVPQFAPHLDADRAELIRDEFFIDALEAKRRQVDLLAKVPTDRGDEEMVLIHVEVEGQARYEMSRRMWQYAMLIRSRHPEPLIPLVVYLRGGKPGIHKDIHTEIVMGEEMVRFHYFSFGLSGSSAEEHLERPEPLAWALSSLMRTEKLKRVDHRLEASRRIVRAGLDGKREHLLFRCVQYYLQLDAEERKEYENMLAKQSNEDVREHEDFWMTRRDWAKLREGREEGRREGRQDLLLDLLEQRFGSVSASTRRRVRAIDSADELTRLAQRVLTAGSLEDLGLA